MTAVERFKRLASAAASRGDIWSHRPASRLVGAWVDPVILAICKAQKGVKNYEDGGRVSTEHESQRLLQLLSPEVLAVILIHEVFGTLIKEPQGAKLTQLALSVGNAVHAEVNHSKLRELELKQRRMEKKMAADKSVSDGGLLDSSGGERLRPRQQSALHRALNSSSSIVSAINYAAMQANIPEAEWSTRDTLLLGTRLIDILIKSAFVKDESSNKFVPAFKHFRTFMKKNNIVGMVHLEDAALKLISHEQNDVSSFIDPKHQPMEVRPRPWVSPKNGGYLRTEVDLVRAPPSHAFYDAIAAADLQPLYDGLNALGDTSWRVNRGVLSAGLELWDRGGDIAGLVSKDNVAVPTKSLFLAEEETAFLLEQKQGSEEELGTSDNEPQHFDEVSALRKLKRVRKAAKKTNRELFSIRSDTQYRLDYAMAFAEKERFYLPHNVDFRGRAYPIPVYLQHMGADLTRAMLTFTKPGVRLGERGVYWLKIHLANLLGADKLAFDERIEVAENALSKAIQVGRDPLSDSNLEWWSKHEDPFQLLAACQEFADAVGRHGDSKAIEDFYSTLPVSMDGSCNGLQHYAALGRDVLGGKQVNLIQSDRPQDVYTAVADFVAKRVEAEALKGNKVAKLVLGKVSRKIVKQTVMTSVYGVTLTGARDQIGNRLKDINFPPDKIFAASLMLGKMTLSSLGDIFSGATKTMDWLSNSAHGIAREGYEVQWVTPVGLPVIQPYRKKTRSIVKTIMQRVTLEQHGDHLPVSTQRQRSAFPPNFVHSIDSSHMLFTAIACKNVGLNYAAVHDSFWTNAATVDTMNEVLREEFVKLHSRELLNEVREGFMMRYPGIKFEELPERGSLQLEEVLDSPYFFS